MSSNVHIKIYTSLSFLNKAAILILFDTCKQASWWKETMQYVSTDPNWVVFSQNLDLWNYICTVITLNLSLLCNK